MAYGLPPLHLWLLQCVPHKVMELWLLQLRVGQRPLLLGLLLLPLVQGIQNGSKNGPARESKRITEVGWVWAVTMSGIKGADVVFSRTSIPWLNPRIPAVQMPFYGAAQSNCVSEHDSTLHKEPTKPPQLQTGLPRHNSVKQGCHVTTTIYVAPSLQIHCLHHPPPVRFLLPARLCQSL